MLWEVLLAVAVELDLFEVSEVELGSSLFRLVAAVSVVLVVINYSLHKGL